MAPKSGVENLHIVGFMVSFRAFISPLLLEGRGVLL